MTAEYERYHGLVIRELVVRAGRRLAIEVWDDDGRVNSFCVNRRVGIHIKHCSKRLAPWGFTFNADSIREISQHIKQHKRFWLALVCGYDGILCLSSHEFLSLIESGRGTTPFIRVDRDRNTMYRVFGNAGKLNQAKPRGVAAILDDVVR